VRNIKKEAVMYNGYHFLVKGPQSLFVYFSRVASIVIDHDAASTTKIRGGKGGTPVQENKITVVPH